MASISHDANGRKRILFSGADGKRHAVRLGKVPERVAKSIHGYIESLATSAHSHTTWEPETAAWVGKLDAVLYGKLVDVGLLPPRDSAAKLDAATLGTFLDSYISGRTDVKPGTLVNMRQAEGFLVRYFGADKPLADITPGCCDDWRLDLLTQLSSNTARKHCIAARGFFRAAKRKRLIAENPFADSRTQAEVVDADKFYFITLPEAYAVLDACPDAQWRLIFALSRFGGLRCPSEHLLLTWDDVDWERGRMTVHSPKTERHHGKASRVVPIFPELRPYLEAAFDEAEPGTVHVITKYRAKETNIGTRMARIIKRAGVKVWPKLFQNLRSTRETELAATHPIHVVCAWIGNSQAVAAKHYLQVTDADFQQAVKGDAECGALFADSVTQNAAQPTSAHIGQHGTDSVNAHETRDFCTISADGGEYGPLGRVVLPELDHLAEIGVGRGPQEINVLRVMVVPDEVQGCERCVGTLAPIAVRVLR